jgi:hypothetical protein
MIVGMNGNVTTSVKGLQELLGIAQDVDSNHEMGRLDIVRGQEIHEPRGCLAFETIIRNNSLSGAQERLYSQGTVHRQRS